jgi:hypothetical protein
VTVSSFFEVSAFEQRVLARGDIDIVDLCTPGHRHADIATAALVAACKDAPSIEPFASTGVSRLDYEDLKVLCFPDATEAIETRGSRRILVHEVYASEIWYHY